MLLSKNRFYLGHCKLLFAFIIVKTHSCLEYFKIAEWFLQNRLMIFYNCKFESDISHSNNDIVINLIYKHENFMGKILSVSTLHNSKS